jgi:N-acetylmuramoyl-L-alanine amidase
MLKRASHILKRASGRRLVLGGLVLLHVLYSGAAAALPPPAKTMYDQALAREQSVRTALAAEGVTPAVLEDVHAVVASYEAIVREYPTSGYSDNALWQAGVLEIDAYVRFNQAADRDAATRLLQSLPRRYPASRLARDVPSQLARLDSTTLIVPEENLVASTKEEQPPKPAPAARLPLAAIKDIRRTVLADAVRITIELDKEVAFRDEWIADPSRVFVDLAATRAAATLVDRTLRFESDADVVRQVRIGRHPNSTTRVVLDVAGVTGYSVYPLYNPYRLVIDCVRSPELTASLAPPASAAQPAAAPPRPAAAPLTPAPEAAPAAPPAAPAPPAKPAIARGPVPLTGRRIATTSMKKLPGMSSRHMTFLNEAHAIDNVLGLAPEGTEPPAAKTLDASAKDTLPSASLTGAVAAPGSAKQAADLPSRNLNGGLSISRQLGLRISRIVIDPGHGGHDPGAIGKGVTEAELVLDVALRLEKLLQKAEGVEVSLTRRTDEFIPLPERTAMANREGADLFLSIHANASANAQARGVETYFLNFAQNLSAAAVAARENAASAQLMGALPDLVKAIALNNKLDESRDFANYVQQSMVSRLKTTNKTIRNLGVKQAPFVVLIGAAMPSVLAEISFVTNAQEAKLLKGNTYRQRIAEALFSAIRKYQGSLKNVTSVASQ